MNLLQVLAKSNLELALVGVGWLELVGILRAPANLVLVLVIAIFIGCWLVFKLDHLVEYSLDLTLSD
jgi:hypothetical protein